MSEPLPLDPREERAYRNLIAETPSIADLELSDLSAVAATQSQWADLARRILATLDATRAAQERGLDVEHGEGDGCDCYQRGRMDAALDVLGAES